MKCFNHPETDANGTCQDCGKGLCGNCIARFDFPLCEPCLLSHNSTVSKQLYMGLAITFIIFIGATYFSYFNMFQKEGIGDAMLFGGFIAGTYWGWRFLTDHLPSLTMGSYPVWMIYLMLKFMVALVIGLFVGPYQIFKMFKELGAIQKVKGQITRGEI